MTITTDAPEALLSLTQWLSPAFPLGAFAYSHGLEAVITNGDVATSDALQDWLLGLLQHGSLRMDAALLARVHQGWDWQEADLEARAMAASKERLEESLAQGRAFVDTTNALLGTELPDLTLPVAVGVQARRLQVKTTTLTGLYLQSFVSNLVLAAVRFVPLGQTEGQRVIARLQTATTQVAQEASQSTELWSTSLAADIAAMAHEHQEVRIFRT